MNIGPDKVSALDPRRLELQRGGKPKLRQTASRLFFSTCAHRIKLGALCALALGWAWIAPAQYNIAQYVIAGGGGQATGDGWTLNATVGQPAAGMATGGGLTLAAGFWTTETAAPRLMISVTTNSATLSWPSATLGFSLQQTAALAPAAWVPVTATPTNNGTMTSVTLPLTSGGACYRLVR